MCSEGLPEPLPPRPAGQSSRLPPRPSGTQSFRYRGGIPVSPSPSPRKDASTSGKNGNPFQKKRGIFRDKRPRESRTANHQTAGCKPGSRVPALSPCSTGHHGWEHVLGTQPGCIQSNFFVACPSLTSSSVKWGLTGSLSQVWFKH